MIKRAKFILVSLALLATVVEASAQSERVSLRPALKPGQQSRYQISASVDTVVTAKDASGIASNVHREVTATILVRAGVSEKGDVIHEAVIESAATRASLDGVDKPSDTKALVGQKIEFSLDSSGRVTKCAIPQAAVDAGLAELVFSLTSWIPAGDVAAGQSWGAGADPNAGAGGYGYISATRIADISKAATTSYKLVSVEGDKAIIEGTIALKQSGGSILTTGAGIANVNVIAAGKGSTRLEYDLAAARITTAATETTLEGRLADFPPTAKGEKLQLREGSLVETSRFSIKLVP